MGAVHVFRYGTLHLLRLLNVDTFSGAQPGKASAGAGAAGGGVE